MTLLLLALVAVAGCVGLGVFLTFMLTKNCRPAEFWGLNMVLGVAGTSWLSFVWSLAGGKLNAFFSWSLLLAGLVLGCVSLYRKKQLSTSELRMETATGLARVSQWVAGLLILSAFIQTVMTPQRFWDERAIFAIKAKVLWSEQSISAPDLKDPKFVQYHAQYPLLLPLAERQIYGIMGVVNDRWSKLIFPLLYAGMVLAYAGVMSRRLGSGWGWLSAVIVASIPVLMPYEYGFLSGQADAPVACFHGLAALYLWDAIQSLDNAEQRRSLIIAGLCAAAVAFTKDEGVAFFLIDALSLLLASLLSRFRIPVRELFWLAIACAPFIAIWFWHRKSLPDTTEMRYFDRFSLALLLDRIPTLNWSIPHLIDRMFLQWRIWGMQWWLAVIAVVTAPRRAIETAQLFLVLNLTGAICALLVAGMVAPAELEEHIGGSSHRYLMQLAPIAILLTMSQWRPDPQATAKS